MSALENLIDDLIHPDTHRARNAQEMLASMREAAVGPLLRALPVVPDQHRWKIILVLNEIGDASASEAMIPFLDSASPAIRAAAAQFLGNYGDERVVETLLCKLNEQSSASSQIWIIQALGKLKDRRAVEALIQLVNNAEAPSVRYNAIEALGRIGDYRAAEVIRQYIDDSDHHVQARAKTALQLLYAQHG